MNKCFFIFVVLFAFVEAVPIPQNDSNGLELLSTDETRYYEFPFFWFGRSVSGDDYDDTVYNGPSVNTKTKRRSSTVSYINVGAGWGR